MTDHRADVLIRDSTEKSRRINTGNYRIITDGVNESTTKHRLCDRRSSATRDLHKTELKNSTAARVLAHNIDFRWIGTNAPPFGQNDWQILRLVNIDSNGHSTDWSRLGLVGELVSLMKPPWQFGVQSKSRSQELSTADWFRTLLSS